MFKKKILKKAKKIKKKKLSIKELDLIPSGIDFHSPGAATGNVLSPQVFSLAFGFARGYWTEDLSVPLEVK